jgi:hypothetical protein
VKQILITQVILLTSIISYSQSEKSLNFISINPGFTIYDDDGLLARNEVELGRTFNRYFSASAILGFETNLTTENSFTGSGYDLSANGYFNFLKPSKKYTLRLGGGIGFGKYTNTWNRLGSLNGNEALVLIPLQTQTQGILANISLEGTRKISSKFEMGLKYTFRIFDADSQIPVLLKFQINL